MNKWLIEIDHVINSQWNKKNKLEYLESHVRVPASIHKSVGIIFALKKKCYPVSTQAFWNDFAW